MYKKSNTVWYLVKQRMRFLISNVLYYSFAEQSTSVQLKKRQTSSYVIFERLLKDETVKARIAEMLTKHI